MNSDDDLAARLRAICMALPEVTERASHGVPAWFVRDKKSFAQLWADGHHGDDFPHLWCAGLPGAQEALIGSAPDRFFRPPYVGHRGWIGARLDGDVDWAELAELCADAYRAVAPATLIALLDAQLSAGCLAPLRLRRFLLLSAAEWLSPRVSLIATSQPIRST